MTSIKQNPDQLAIGIFPEQEWCEPYDLMTALAEGTIFQNLNMPFFKAPFDDSNINLFSNTDNSDQQKREEKMSRLMAVSFAINDLTLYLDTHPDCEKGLTLFYQLLDERLKLLTEYATLFNPLTQTSMVTGECSRNHYSWCDGPLPWEGACI